MPSPPIRAFVFDLDGTLIDSKMDIVHSVNAMLRVTGRKELPTEQISGFVGHGAPQLIASVLGPEANEFDRQNALSTFLAHYENHCLEETRVYPGVKEGLAALSGYPKAVLTNKPSRVSRQILQGLGLLDFFAAIGGGDSFERKKPAPEGALSILETLGVACNQAAMVGDSDVDIQTARNAEMFAIAVTYGFGKHNTAAHPADLYVHSLDELCALLPGYRS